MTIATSRTFRTKDKLVKSNDFKDIKRNGRSKGYKNLVFAWIENGKFPRLGLSLSRRVGPAVTRNRLKRLLREWFRENRAKIGNFDLHIIVRTHNNLSQQSLTDRRRGIEDDLKRFISYISSR